MSRVDRPVMHRANGFTLIEMLVALAVFSLAALAMVNLQAFSVRTAATLSDSALAWQVAQNLAVERLSAPLAPAIGTEQGESRNGGRNWRWNVTTERLDDDRFVRLAIAVEGTGRKAQLTAIRLVEK